MTMTDTLDTGKVKAKQSQGKPKRERKYRTLSGDASGKDTTLVKYEGEVLGGIDWDKLDTGSLFSTRPDGKFPKLKDSISSYFDIRTQSKETGIVSGTAYPVII